MVELAQHHAIRTEKSGCSNLPFIGPARRAIGLDILGLPRPPDRHGDRHRNRNESSRRRDEGTLDKDLRCIGIVDEPPPEEDWRVVDLPARQFEPGAPELWLVGEPPGCPLGCSPNGEQNNQADNDHLAPEDFGSRHSEGPSLIEFGEFKLEAEVALATKTPFNAAAVLHDAGDVLAELLFELARPGHELEAKPVVDHGEASRGEPQALAIGARHVFTGGHLPLRKPDVGSDPCSDLVQLASAQRV